MQWLLREIYRYDANIIVHVLFFFFFSEQDANAY